MPILAEEQLFEFSEVITQPRFGPACSHWAPQVDDENCRQCEPVTTPEEPEQPAAVGDPGECHPPAQDEENEDEDRAERQMGLVDQSQRLAGRSRQGSLERLSSRCVTSPTLGRSDAAARSIDWVPTAVREGQQSSSTINSELPSEFLNSPTRKASIPSGFWPLGVEVRANPGPELVAFGGWNFARGAGARDVDHADLRRAGEVLEPPGCLSPRASMAPVASVPVGQPPSPSGDGCRRWLCSSGSAVGSSDATKPGCSMPGEGHEIHREELPRWRSSK